jgi:hypothetical protein
VSADISTIFAAPPALGSTTPAAVTGTTVKATTGDFGTGASLTLSSSSASNLGNATAASLFIVRDSTNGGSAIVYFGEAATITIIAQSGNSSFITTGSPTSTEILISNSSTQLTVKAGSSRNGDNFVFVQLAAQ